METLKNVDWITLLLGIALGIPVALVINVVTNLFNPRLVAFLDSRRVANIRRSKDEALRVYARVKAFHEGTRDRYPFYLLLSSAAVICAIAASTCIVIVTVLNPEDPKILIVAAIIFVLFILLFLVGLYSTAHATDHFEDYRKEVERKWGPLDDDPPTP